MKIRFTPSGDRQFLGAISYILADKQSAARRFHARAMKSLQRLKQFPLSGRPVPEFPALPYRELVIGPYRFFYRAVGDTIWIVGVWHSAQLPSEPIAPDAGA